MSVSGSLIQQTFPLMSPACPGRLQPSHIPIMLNLGVSHEIIARLRKRHQIFLPSQQNMCYSSITRLANRQMFIDRQILTVTQKAGHLKLVTPYDTYISIWISFKMSERSQLHQRYGACTNRETTGGTCSVTSGHDSKRRAHLRYNRCIFFFHRTSFNFFSTSLTSLCMYTSYTCVNIS